MDHKKTPADWLIGTDSDTRIVFLRIQAIAGSVVLGALSVFNLAIGYTFAAFLDLLTIAMSIGVYVAARRFGMTDTVRRSLALCYGFLVLSSVLLDGIGGIFWVSVFIVLSFFLMGRRLATGTACTLIAIAALTAAPTDPYHVLLFTMSNVFLTFFLYFFTHHSEVLEFTRRSHLRTDNLTAALNRRALDEDLSRILSEKRGPLPLLMLLDVDHFKMVNDSLGHVAGDLCLTRIAERIRDLLHGLPVTLYRYGGDEFAIVCHGDLRQGEHLAGLIRNRISETSILPERTVTLSIGIASLRQSDTVADALIRADEALYNAKDAGRDRAVVA